MSNNNSLVVMPFAEKMQMAEVMAKSGLFQDTRQAGQALVKIQAGEEMGIPPFAAMTGIHIIKGKPVPGANLIAAAIRRHPNYDYVIDELTDKICTITIIYNGKPAGSQSFTIADAKQAGTQNLQKFPRNMLFARCISNVAKWHCPDLFGGAPVYVPEDFGLETDGDGNIIDIDPEPITAPPTRTPRPPAPPKPPKPPINPPDPAPPVQDEPHVAPSSTMFRKFHALGKEVYGPDWDSKRSEFCDTFGVDSSRKLSKAQVQKLIDGMNGKLAQRDGEGVDLAELAEELDGEIVAG